MKYPIKATAYSPESGYAPFPATVPGNVQADFLAAYPQFCPDLQYADNYKKLIPMESWSWVYTIDTSDVTCRMVKSSSLSPKGSTTNGNCG